MKQKFISKTVGMWLVIGGGVVLVAAFITQFATLLSVYSIAGTCDVSCTPDNLHLREVLVRLMLWAIFVSAATIVAGIVIMFLAKTNKENTNK